MQFCIGSTPKEEPSSTVSGGGSGKCPYSQEEKIRRLCIAFKVNKEKYFHSICHPLHYFTHNISLRFDQIELILEDSNSAVESEQKSCLRILVISIHPFTPMCLLQRNLQAV